MKNLKQISEIATKSLKDVVSALTGKYAAEACKDYRITVQGHQAFVESKDHPDELSLPVKVWHWYPLGSAQGFTLYFGIIQD